MAKHGQDHNQVPITDNMSPAEKAAEFDALDNQLAADMIDAPIVTHPAVEAYEKKGRS